MMSFGIRRSRVLLLLCLALLDVALPRAVAARRPAASPGAATGASGGSAAARRAPARLRVLFLRVAFPDRPSKRPPEDIQNASRSGLVDRLVGYYDEVSSRRFHIDASVSTRVYTLPRPRAEYVDKTEEMVRDALAAATAPSAERARIARLKPQAVVVFFAGPGEESDMQGTSRADPWSNTVIGTRFDAAGTVVDRATVVGEDRKIALGAVERSAQVVKILAKGPEAPGEYFLIENRRRIGADRSLPGEGLLVWHVDESLTSFRRSQDEVDHKRLDLLTADSWPSHLDRGVSHGGNRGDAGDPWSARREGPGPDTAPSTRAYEDRK